MKTIIVTGSAGLVGSECVEHFTKNGFRVVGIENDTRGTLFGMDASVFDTIQYQRNTPNYERVGIDIRNRREVDMTFCKVSRESEIAAVIHCAAQPSHDWAASNPQADWDINANGTMYLLQMARMFCEQSPFVFTSTNKVYGDAPNQLCVDDWDGEKFNAFYESYQPHSDCNLEFGIDESMTIDQSKHSLFGASKLAADILVQEYGRYFGMNTVAFRCGCLTGPAHAGTKLHGFLSYLVKCCVTGEKYTVIGYGGKQVRDNIHSADLVEAFAQYIAAPRPGEVYNIGGGRENSCSVLEAIAMTEQVTGRKMNVEFDDTPRSGDHKWWITDYRKFQSHYPEWKITRSLERIIREIADGYARKAA